MKSILVIEDDPVMCGYLRDILELEHFHPQVAANGPAGLLAVRRDPPDLILCDVSMPRFDGYQVLAALRADATTVRIPFIFLTAKGEHTDIRTGMNLGADDYLVKPVPMDELLGAIAARLERAQQQTGFQANFSSALPLEKIGLTPREAEVLFWVAQGKTNFEIGVILGICLSTVKKHLESIYPELGVEGRNAATLKALQTLSLKS